MIKVLYEDNHLLAVEKPPNIPVQQDASDDADMLTLLKSYIKEKYSKPGDVYLGLVHRLDRPVGGAMVFARTSKAASRLCAQFNGHSAKKAYFAVIQAYPKDGMLTDYMLRDESTGNSSVVPEGTPGAKPARLSYNVLAHRGGLTLVRIDLATGRHHQIRVQFASRKMPLWGDQRYNPGAVPGQQIALWAFSLTVEHPTKKQPLTFISLPSGGVWDMFSDVLPSAAAGTPVVYMDEDIIAVDKPAGLTTAAADGGEDSLESRLAEIYGSVFPAHRLDANTKGLVLFARNPEALEALNRAISSRQLRKFYRCTVKGAPPKTQDTLTAYCSKNSEIALLTVSDRPFPGCSDMVTRYRVLSTGSDRSELEVELITGRTHQIRAHLAHIGCPILGDDKYGDREFNRQNRARTQQLCAVRIELHFQPDSPLARLEGRVIEIDG